MAPTWAVPGLFFLLRVHIFPPLLSQLYSDDPFNFHTYTHVWHRLLLPPTGRFF